MNFKKAWVEHGKAGMVGAGAAVLLGLLLNFSPIGYGLTHLSYDLLLALEPQKGSTGLVIVQVDEELLQPRTGNSAPLVDRAALARLIDRLRTDQSGVVAIDIVLDLPGPADADDKLAAAIKSHGRVVLAAAEEQKQRSFAETRLQVVQTRPRMPLDEFLAAAGDHWGFCDLNLDSDSAVRTHSVGTESYPSLPWRAAALTGAAACKDERERRAPKWLRYYGPSEAFEELSYAEALRKPDHHFSGKAVFIGKRLRTPFLDEGPDEFRTPYSRWGGKYIAGVEILATNFLNLVQRDWLTRSTAVSETVLLVLAGIGFAFGLGFFRPAPATLCAASGMIGAALIAWVMLAGTRVWFPWAVVAGAQIPTALLSAIISHSGRSAQEKEQLLTEARRLAREKKKLEKALAKKPMPISETVAATRVAPNSVVIKDFDLLKRIGEGAYGEVWLARNTVGMYQAVKVVYQIRLSGRDNYEREFNGIRSFMPLSLKHPGLLKVLHVGRNDHEGFYHYVMELGDDETAGQRIDPETYSARSLGKDLEKGRIPLPACIDWGVALSSALAFLHSNKLVHRDIKPGNIIFVNGAPKLADIGLVTEMDRAGMSIVGTPAFMDQALHGTPAGDLFSLGKVLYVTATGCPPDQFPRWPDNLASDLQTAGGSTFRTIILRACGRETHQPYASVAEMHSDLQGLRSAIAGIPSAENARPA